MKNLLFESDPVSISGYAGGLVRRLERAKSSFAAYGVKIAKGSRIDQTIELLAAVSRRGSIEGSSHQLQDLIRAFWVAMDLCEIADNIPSERIREVRAQIATVCSGDFWPMRGKRQALQLQSQQWISDRKVN
jgi:hypothetical protein